MKAAILTRDIAREILPARERDSKKLNDAWRSYTRPAEPVFHESGSARLRRWVLGAGYAVKPGRIGVLPQLSLMTANYLLSPRATRDRLPDELGLHGPLGLAGVSNELGVGTLIERYSRGLFPICHMGPMKWWSPSHRAVIAPGEIQIERSTRKLLRQNRFMVTFDEDFASDGSLRRTTAGKDTSDLDNAAHHACVLGAP